MCSRSSNSGRHRTRNCRYSFFPYSLKASSYSHDRHDNNNSNTPQYYYRPEPNAGPISESCRFTEEQINRFLQKRRECQRSRQFDKADQILTGLNQHGVYVHDKRREWRADGENHFGRSVHNSYVRRGGIYGVLSDEDIMAVSKLVEDRSYAKRRKEFHRSDAMTDILKTKYNVKVDDKNREWSVSVKYDAESDADADVIADHTMHNTHIYVPSPLAPLDHPTHTMSDEVKAQIAQRLSHRVSCRKKKDYSSADKIRDELMEQYSIAIDDRTREWKVVEYNNKETDDPFVTGASLSQRSAFVRGGNDSNNFIKESNDESGSEKQTIISIDTTATSISSSFPDDVIISPLTTIVAENIEYEEDDLIEANQQEEEREALNSLTVVKLKDQLRQAGLPVSGRKSDLVDRIIDNVQ